MSPSRQQRLEQLERVLGMILILVETEYDLKDRKNDDFKQQLRRLLHPLVFQESLPDPEVQELPFVCPDVF
jgi:hypothetical protein